MASPFFCMHFYKRFTAAYSRLLSWFLVASVAIIIVPVSLQIFSRYTDLIPSYIWTEELARFCFVWMVMIGAMVGVRDSSHFEVDVWPKLSPRASALVRIVAGLGVLGFALVFVWGGYLFTAFAWKRLSELAELPLWMIHIAWPITGITWLLFQGEHMADALRVLFGRNGDATPAEQTT